LISENISMPDAQSNLNYKKMIRNFIVELTIYGVLIFVYFIVILQFFNDYLTEAFENNLLVYSGLALMFIVAQGVLLDYVTTFLIKKLNLDEAE